MAARRRTTKKVASKPIEAAEQQVGQDSPIDIPTTGSIEGVDKPEFETVEGPGAMHKAEELAFMEEPVEVMVHESTDPNNVEPIVQLSVNGRSQFVIRGKQETIRRKYVEVLARSKHTGFTQTTEHDPRTGNVSQRMNPHTALRYPFSVISDRNPNGAAWLKKVLAEA